MASSYQHDSTFNVYLFGGAGSDQLSVFAEDVRRDTETVELLQTHHIRFLRKKYQDQLRWSWLMFRAAFNREAAR